VEGGLCLVSGGRLEAIMDKRQKPGTHTWAHLQPPYFDPDHEYCRRCLKRRRVDGTDPSFDCVPTGEGAIEP